MALSEEGGGIPATMLVGPTSGMPAYAGGNSTFGNGDGWWIILLFILLAGNGGWGNNANGGFGGGYGLYPWLNNSNQINDGFRDTLMNDNITEIRSGVTGLATQLCNCCGDVQMALANGFAGVEQGANARQIANMQTAFAGQTAMNQGFNSVQSQLANCCCENRLATNDLKYTIATENCADRYASAQNTRDIIDSQTRGTQAILDKLCTLELDGYKRENDQLRTQLNMANLAASQTAQTVQIRNSIIDELRSCPIPSQPVYGTQPIFTCGCGGSGVGCGCGGVA
jgi:hypothetical protein